MTETVDYYALARKHFPYPAYNAGQEHAIVEIVKALKLGIPHVIAEVPTGVGKSAIAYTVHKMMEDMNDWHRTTIVTASKGLQDQYTSEYEDMFDLKGKANYKCVKGAESYGTSKCKSIVYGGKCNAASECPYVIRRDHWCNKAALRLTNTSFQIEAGDVLINTIKTRAKLIVIDECHELANQLIHHNVLKLSLAALPISVKMYGDAFVKKVTACVSALSSIGTDRAFRLADIDSDPFERLNASVESVMLSLKSRMENGEFSPQLTAVMEEMQGISNSLSTFTATVNGEWILVDYEKNRMLEVKPVYAKQVANRGMFRKSDQFVHLSATICGFDEYRNNLGLRKEDCFNILIDNPIPVENRRIMLTCDINVNKDVDPKELAASIDAIIAKHDNKNGVIHTVSFKLANDIVDNSRFRKRMIVSNDRKEILKLLNNHNSGAIVLSPSIETGYDFKGDMARWQILAKVPYGYMGDPFVKLNMSRDSSWYARQAILRMVQASGRIVRGMTDYGDTYIVDSNAARLLSTYASMFPDWYIDALEL